MEAEILSVITYTLFNARMYVMLNVADVCLSKRRDETLLEVILV